MSDGIVDAIHAANGTGVSNGELAAALSTAQERIRVLEKALWRHIAEENNCELNTVAGPHPQCTGFNAVFCSCALEARAALNPTAIDKEQARDIAQF